MKSYIELIEKEEINPALAIFKFKFNNPINFKPGQYITIISNIDSNRILRPYSISSAPYQLPEIEFFIRKVKNGEKPGIFTSKLFEAKEGTRYEILKVSGLFLLDENDKRKKIFVSSGTGLGPYISMIRQEIKDRGKCNCIIIHGVSHDYDLGYEKELNRYEKEGKIIKYIPTVSRKEENPEWKGEFGRAETLMEDRINKILNEKITKENYVIYACGHPGMIENIVKIFKLKGFIENKDIKFEKYWSQPKKITEQRIQIK